MKLAVKRTLVVAAVLAVLSLAAITAQDDDEGGSGLFAKSEGTAGLKWVGGNEGSSLMNPGMTCIACHTRGEGPRFAAAGTVYAKLDERTLDLGVQGATVEITDAKGQVLKLETNKSGNFSTRRFARLAFPITAKVIYKGKVNQMYTPQASGDCNSCHSAAGSNGAPGRVVIPN